MTSVCLLQTCFISACSNALFLRDSNSLNVHKALVVARRTTSRAAATASAVSRYKNRRNQHSATTSPYRRRRTSSLGYFPDFLRKTSHPLAAHKLTVKRPEPTHRPLKDRLAGMEQMISLQHSLEEAMMQPVKAPHQAPDAQSKSQPRASMGHCGGAQDEPNHSRSMSQDSVPSSPSQSEDLENRSVRSASTTSRSTNRLSLTLPILPPNAFPSRPTPTSATVSSYPSTPLDTPSLRSPMDSNDFITAIAAQERRVLELREELSRAESELTKLKKQYATHEAHRKRTERRHVEPLRPLGPHSEAQLEDPATRRSVELDRRRALLLGQHTQHITGERSGRRVFSGAHTRTLSLLSPTRPTNGFPLHEDRPTAGHVKSKSGENDTQPYPNRYAPVTPAQLSKRASWAPRSVHQASGVKQLAEDFKAGLWTFVEDLRQATVGEEPITGQGQYLRGNDGNMRSTANNNSIDAMLSENDRQQNQDTIRASTNSRPRVSSAFDDTTPKQRSSSTAADGHNDEGKGGSRSTSPSKPMRPLSRSKTESFSSNKTKHFSWTPLTVDSYDDNDWSNWDSPTVNSPRWSGTTMNGDIIPSIPEKRDENETPIKKKASKSRLASTTPLPSPGSNKLEELLPPVLNRLTPSKLKQTASDFMKEWEKSLSSPPPLSEPSPTSLPNSPLVAAAAVVGNNNNNKEKGT
ncbi:hypothetical protein QBC46DRAFT_60580 [Diplogelasinospora grovesii]|uniref:DUF4048 domain-containing protein n=1 Tax=Diplogelasinospora grovesii TaxID=303347 RepID=A0AAN6NHC2_9PEZI|nr:hypothetical protein QBC46DRAFT_60580 [Diplogelasinospora grovesii]